LTAAAEALADALLGANLPLDAARHLHDAGLAYAEDAVAEQHLRDAQAVALDHAAVLIARYRFYFYEGRLRDALVVARVVCSRAEPGRRSGSGLARSAPGGWQL
jgi:predicted Zn-dependent protease